MALTPLSLRHLALKATLLTGLLMIGLVDEGASASSTRADVAQTAPGPAAIELLIETENGSFSRVVYFPWDSIDLTPAAQAAVFEIASEVSALENPAISIASQTGDELLAFERVNAVARGLEREGFSSARLFTWSEIDMLMPRQL